MKNKVIDYNLIDESCRYWLLSRSEDGKEISYVEGSITIQNDNTILWSGVFFNDNSVKFPDRIFNRDEFIDGLIKTHSIVRKHNSERNNYIPKDLIAFEKLNGGMYLAHTIPILVVNCLGVSYACEDPDYLKTESELANEKKFSEEDFYPYNEKTSKRKIRFLKWYSCERIKDREFSRKRITYDALYILGTLPIFIKNYKKEKTYKNQEEENTNDSK